MGSLPTVNTNPPWTFGPHVIAQPWTFTQLGGPGKSFQLGGLDAPWGRPRRGAVVVDETEVRENTVYYAGSNLPTRHIFGLHYAPWELYGRFGDRNPVSSNPTLMSAGNGYAKAICEYIKQFVSDQQPIRVQWGNIISAQGFIRKFVARREAEYEVEWHMVVLIDSDETTPQTTLRTTTTKPSKTSSAAAAAAAALQTFSIPPSILALSGNPNASYDAVVKGSVLDFLESAVSSVNSAIANLVAISQVVDSVEKATIGDLKRLRAGIGQAKTAITFLKDSWESVAIDAASLQRTFLNDWAVQGGKAINDLVIQQLQADMATLDRHAEIAERGQAYSSYVAVYGDSWEAISTKLYGGPDQANAIRQANGITGGTQPVPGRSYKIPFPS